VLPVTVNLDAYRGDTWSQVFAFKRGGTSIDIAGSAFKASARNEFNVVFDLPVEKMIPELQLAISLPEGGLLPDVYDYDIEVTEPSTDITTWVKGRLTVSRDVTNELP